MNSFILFLTACINFSLFAFTPPIFSQGEIVEHHYYTLSYSEEHEQAEWVAYHLTPDFILGSFKREDDFRMDPLVSTDSASPNDYRNSGFDKGHLVPAGDMKLNALSMSETFFMSNISPQEPKFNQGLWRLLEEEVRQWVVDKSCDCYVITGSFLNEYLEKIPGTGISIPNYFYKIVLKLEADEFEVLAFLMPNTNLDGHDLNDYAVSVDEIEELTGLDFFTDLDDNLEEIIESVTGELVF
ncbi:MAG: DNA/RNA non-specific endonuclease [Halobacteriovoraceae bacterium]|nr:DNA/RNA non-specific endonuclease [Halobacteriovoraceae bacterium]